MIHCPDEDARLATRATSGHPSPASVARSPEVLNQHQVGSIADQPAIENCPTIW
jgi:hypothetical protein